jgi:anti-repressor protein
MNQLVNPSVLSITSAEIADLVDSRHDVVKKSIDRLIERGVITSPPMVEKATAGRPVQIYSFSGAKGKRDSIIVVAQLSPEFTARLVDRWQELENANKPQIPQSFPEALRLAAELAEQNHALTSQIAADAPKVDFADRVEKSSGVLIGHFAKAIGVGPNRLFAWMRANGYLIATAGSRYNTPYQKYLERGYFDVTESSYDANGETRASFTTHITGKGQLRITAALKECGMISEVAK